MNEESNLENEGPNDFLFLWACGFELAIGLVGLILAWAVGVDARAYLGDLQELSMRTVWIQIGIGTLAALPMLGGINLLMKIRHDSITAIKRLAEVPTMRALLKLTPAELITLSICAGVGEELAFRGVLLPWLTALRDVTAPENNPFQVGDSFLAVAKPSILIAAVFLSSIAFGFLHPITKLYVFVASLMGAYFAALMIATDSLLVPIVAHSVYDAIQFLMARRDIDADIDDDGQYESA